MFQCNVECRGHRCCVFHHDQVGARHHDLASNGVAELDDALDQLAFLVLHHAVLSRDLDDSQQLLLGDKRTRFQTLAAHDDVGELDQPARDPLQNRKSDEQRRRAGNEECSSLRIKHRVRLGHRFREHVEHDNVEHDADGNGISTEHPPGHDRSECCLHSLTDVDGEQEWVRGARRVFHEPLQCLARLQTLVRE